MKSTKEPWIGPCCAGESGSGSASSASTLPPSGRAKMLLVGIARKTWCSASLIRRDEAACGRPCRRFGPGRKRRSSLSRAAVEAVRRGRRHLRCRWGLGSARRPPCIRAGRASPSGPPRRPLKYSSSRRRRWRTPARPPEMWRAAAEEICDHAASAGESLLRDAGRVTIAPRDRDRALAANPGLKQIAQAAQRLRPVALGEHRGRRRASPWPDRCGCEGSVQCETRRLLSEPGPSVSSQTVLATTRLSRPPRPCSMIRCSGSASTIVVSIQAELSGGWSRNRAPAPTPPDSIRVR